MPRYDVVQRRKAQKDLQRRWELPAGSRVWRYLQHSPGDNQTSQLESPQLAQDEIEMYITDIRGVLQTGSTGDRQELLRRFIRSIVLYPNHVEIEYNFGLSALAPLGNFGVSRSPLDGAPGRLERPHPAPKPPMRFMDSCLGFRRLNLLRLRSSVSHYPHRQIPAR